jgi:hypothetical protein
VLLFADEVFLLHYNIGRWDGHAMTYPSPMVLAIIKIQIIETYTSTWDNDEYDKPTFLE